MKFYSKGIMNEKFKGGLFRVRQTRYYAATGKSGLPILLWMEDQKIDGVRSYPCFIKDNGEIFYFSQKDDPDYLEENTKLMTRWFELISKENVHTLYDVEELVSLEFTERYRYYLDTEVYNSYTPIEPDQKEIPDQCEQPKSE